MEDIDHIIRRVLSGDTALYEEVVKAYEGKVSAIIVAMIPDPNMVDDITQDAFVVAYQRLSSYRLGTNFPAWLKTIARNVAQNERRRWYRRRELECKYQAQVEEIVEDEIDRIVESLPEDVLESLRGCVEGLGDKTRDVVDAFYFHEKAMKELAEALDMTLSSVKVTLHRARLAISKCLSRKGHGNV